MLSSSPVCSPYFWGGDLEDSWSPATPQDPQWEFWLLRKEVQMHPKAKNWPFFDSFVGMLVSLTWGLKGSTSPTASRRDNQDGEGLDHVV